LDAEVSQIQSLLIETITPKIGAEIDNVDLGILCDREIIDIKEAFIKHLVLVFRDHQITR
jgi:alpha-ketoglutarate-dependent taurine dioxygenase